MTKSATAAAEARQVDPVEEQASLARDSISFQPSISTRGSRVNSAPTCSARLLSGPILTICRPSLCHRPAGLRAAHGRIPQREYAAWVVLEEPDVQFIMLTEWRVITERHILSE